MRCFLVIGFLISFSFSSLEAGINHSFDIVASAPFISKLSTKNAADQLFFELGTQASTGLLLGKIVFSSNASRFKLSLSSANNGKLKRVETDSGEYVLNPSYQDEIEYTVTLSEENKSKYKDVKNYKNILLISPQEVIYEPFANESVFEEKVIQILINTPKKSELNGGNYKDLLSISLLDSE